MSLFNQPYAVPSRVKGAVQLLVRERGQRLKRDTAEVLLSPASLEGEEGEADKVAMIRRTIDECVRLGLFVQEDEVLSLHPALPEPVRRPDTVADALPAAILERILEPADGPNADMAAALAWYLGQDALGAPGTWRELGPVLQEQGVAGVLDFNDVRFVHFRHWSRYLGLANVIATPAVGSAIGPSGGGKSEKRLAPDPTECLRRVLRDVLVACGGRSSIADTFRRLSAQCSLFEGGAVRETMDRYAPRREGRHLSSTTSLALLRLQAEGTIALSMLSDADAFVLVDGPGRVRVSEIVWVRDARVAA